MSACEFMLLFCCSSSCLLAVNSAVDVCCDQVWGCGGQAARQSLVKQKEWEQQAVTKEQNRKVLSVQ